MITAKALPGSSITPRVRSSAARLTSRYAATALRGLPEKKAEAFAQVLEAVLALQRDNKDTLWGSMVKETMKRKRPSFNESYYGFRSFNGMLEEAERRGRGSTSLDGWVIDVPVVKRARALLELARRAREER
mgnify:CR=1 FL=1